MATHREHDYDSIPQMQRSVRQRSVADPAAFVRASYVRVLNSCARLMARQSTPPSQKKSNPSRAWRHGFRVVSG